MDYKGESAFNANIRYIYPKAFIKFTIKNMKEY